EALRLVVDRRRPGPLLHRLRDEVRAAIGIHARERPWVAAGDPERVAEPRAPAADRVLEHAAVVEGALFGPEARVLEDRAELRRPGGGRRARGEAGSRGPA